MASTASCGVFAEYASVLKTRDAGRGGRAVVAQRIVGALGKALLLFVLVAGQPIFEEQYAVVDEHPFEGLRLLKEGLGLVRREVDQHRLQAFHDARRRLGVRAGADLEVERLLPTMHVYDEPVGHGVLHRQQQPEVTPLQHGPRPSSTHAERPPEELGLDAALLRDGLHDLAVHLSAAKHPRRLDTQKRCKAIHVRAPKHGIGWQLQLPRREQMSHRTSLS